MSAADLIAMGVDVMSQDDDYLARPFRALFEIIEGGDPTLDSEAAGLREVVAMLRDAADSAIDAHDGAPDVDPVTIGRMRRFSGHLTAALKEIR